MADTCVPVAQPIPATGRQRSGSIDASALATSPTLSASQRFAALSLSPPTTLQSDSFKQAVEHARSLSFGASSVSTASRASSESSEPDDVLITPPSTSPRLNRVGSVNGGKKVADSEIVLEDDEEDEEEEMDALWARGARWGFPISKVPSGPPPVRRGSLGGPPSMAPLTRVASAGSAASARPAPEGLGLFRRFSIGTSRPKPPSPPPSMAEHVPLTKSNTAPVPAPEQSQNNDKSRTGRGPFAGSGTKPKRKLSPMGERMLRGGAFD